MAVQTDGKIIVVGSAGGKSADYLTRYNVNGTLDTTFGSGGNVTNIPVNGGNLLIQPDGKIVLAGSPTTQAGCAVARFNANGTTDSSFGTGGVVFNTSLPSSNGNGGVALQSDGKIVVSGNVSTQLCLFRFNANGTSDATFGTSGNGVVIMTEFNDGRTDGVEVQSDGKIIATAILGPNAQYTVGGVGAVRVNTDGTLDTSYGNGGAAIFGIGTVTSLGDVNGGWQGFQSELGPDGRLVLVGWVDTTSGTTPCYELLVRFLQSAPQIGTFTANPNPVASGSNVTLTASNITDGNPNSTITQVTFYYFDANGNQVVLGTGTQDSSGNWALTLAINLPSGSYTLYAQAQDNYGALGNIATVNLQVL
jgi:uncharacterized delta-60 repeat protein